MLNVTDATLTSIAISPTGPQISSGGSEQFVATGIFSDGTRRT